MRLSVAPVLSRADEGVNIVVSAVQPGGRVLLAARLVDLEGIEWRSEGHFDADVQGTVDVARFASVAGTYEGVDQSGLFWSMVPQRDPGSTSRSAIPALTPGRPHEVVVTATDSKGLSVTTAIERTWAGAGVVRHEVTDGRVRGIFHEPPPDIARTVGAIVMPGSDGGVNEYLAPLIASHGYPTLSLAYFGYADLPEVLADIPLEYFVEASDWLRSRVSRVVAIGASRGTEAVALTAAYFPQFADGVVLYVPTHIVEPGSGPAGRVPVPAWTVGGVGIPSAPHTAEMVKLQAQPPGGGLIWATPVYLDKWAQDGMAEQYGIPIERITVPILLLSGANDALWPSSVAAALLQSRAKAQSPHRRIEHVAYQGAGHLIGRPGAVSSLSATMHHPHAGVHLALGGLPSANAAASMSAFRRTLQFLDSV